MSLAERTSSPLSEQLQASASGERFFSRLAVKIGVDRTLLYRVAVSEIANPGLDFTAKVLTFLGKERAYEVLHQAVPKELLKDTLLTVFSDDTFIAEGNFGQQLRAYRERKNMRGKDVEPLSGIGWEEVLKIERNNRSPRFFSIARLVNAYELNPDQTFHLLETAAKAK